MHGEMPPVIVGGQQLCNMNKVCFKPWFYWDRNVDYSNNVCNVCQFFLDLRINLRNQRKRQTKCQSLLQPRDRKHTNKFDRSEELRWRSSLVHEPTCNISIA